MNPRPTSDEGPYGRPSPGTPPSGAHRRSAYDASPYDHQLSTDPGRSHAYESLYRGSPERGRPTPRHWEPSLTPPEALAEGDTYGWLYRPEPADAPTLPRVTQPPVTQPPVTQPPVTQPPVTQPPVTQPPVIQAQRSSDSGLKGPRPVPAVSAPTPASVGPASHRTGRTVRRVLLLVLILGLAAAAGMFWQY